MKAVPYFAIAGVLSLGGVALAGSNDPPASPTPTYYDIDTPNPPTFDQETGSGGPDYFIIGYEATDQTTTDSGSYFDEVDVPAGNEYDVTLQSATGDDPVTLSDAGYFLSPTEIPLDQLNFGDYPPPGSPGSPFTPIPGLDAQLSSGGSLSADVSVPEPGSLVLLGAGALVLVRRRRRLS